MSGTILHIDSPVFLQNDQVCQETRQNDQKQTTTTRYKSVCDPPIGIVGHGFLSNYDMFK